jgi:hypothetical protein
MEASQMVSHTFMPLKRRRADMYSSKHSKTTKSLSPTLITCSKVEKHKRLIYGSILHGLLWGSYPHPFLIRRVHMDNTRHQ